MYFGKLVFATNNANKVKEVAAQLDGRVPILSLKEIGCLEELPETHDTIPENSEEKALYLFENYHYDCFAEDTGLEVDFLNGAPGVDTAFYGGPQKNDNDNISLLLKNIEGVKNRTARFRTVITLIIAGQQWQFEGIANGNISETRMGSEGFGYDPVFIPENSDRSFAQMSLAEKAEISHRGKAVRQLVDFLVKFS